MAIVKLVCTRNTEATNLTFGVGVYGALTVTGEIYDCEGYQSLVTNEYGIYEKVDTSTSLIKCIGTVSFRGNAETYSAIKQQVANYFQELAESNIFDIKVGLVIKGKVNPPAKGMHPTLNIPTRTVIINNAELIEVEEPELLEMAEELIESTTLARENAKERNTAGLSAYLKAGIKKSAAALGKSLFDSSAAKMADAFIEEQKTKPGKRKAKC